MKTSQKSRGRAKADKVKTPAVVDSDSDNGSSDGEGEEEYVVEKIVGRRKMDGTDEYEYLIKWENYPIEEATWEAETNLNCSELLAEFKRSQKDPPKKIEKSGSASKKAPKRKADSDDESDHENEEIEEQKTDEGDKKEKVETEKKRAKATSPVPSVPGTPEPEKKAEKEKKSSTTKKQPKRGRGTSVEKNGDEEEHSDTESPTETPAVAVRKRATPRKATPKKEEKEKPKKSIETAQPSIRKNKVNEGKALEIVQSGKPVVKKRAARGESTAAAKRPRKEEPLDEDDGVPVEILGARKMVGLNSESLFVYAVEVMKNNKRNRDVWSSEKLSAVAPRLVVEYYEKLAEFGVGEDDDEEEIRKEAGDQHENEKEPSEEQEVDDDVEALNGAGDKSDDDKGSLHSNETGPFYNTKKPSENDTNKDMELLLDDESDEQTGREKEAGDAMSVGSRENKESGDVFHVDI